MRYIPRDRDKDKLLVLKSHLKDEFKNLVCLQAGHFEWLIV